MKHTISRTLQRSSAFKQRILSKASRDICRFMCCCFAVQPTTKIRVSILKQGDISHPQGVLKKVIQIWYVIVG